MGWGAAQAFAEETGFSAEDSYDMLYGDGKPNPNRCPICNHKCRSLAGVAQHMAAKHANPKHADRIAAWLAENRP